MKKNSEVLKTEAMAWLRYGKRMFVVCSEVGRWSADVLGLSLTTSIEVEVKVSKSDFKAEFKNKIAKHSTYTNASEALGSVPNFFYFIVPEELETAALEIAAAGNPKAGVLVFTETNLRLGENIRSAKPAVRLRSGKPSKALVRAAIMRMSSELCNLHAANNRIITIDSELRRMTQSAICSSYRDAGCLDFEDKQAALECKAQELAVAVGGLDWSQIPPHDRVGWLRAAEKLLDITEPSMERWNNEAYDF